jgi:hypothetical protein
VQVLGLERLIQSKEYAGRGKDLVVLASTDTTGQFTIAATGPAAAVSASAPRGLVKSDRETLKKTTSTSVAAFPHRARAPREPPIRSECHRRGTGPGS